MPPWPSCTSPAANRSLNRGGRLGAPTAQVLSPAPINKTPIALAAVERRCPGLVARGASREREASRQSGNDPATHGKDLPDFSDHG
jgi:hypothetical protein